jgi:hypothetical protein
MKIPESRLEALLGNSDLVLMTYMTLSSLPIGGEVNARYGKIRRISDTDFKIEINASILSKNLDSVIKSESPKESISKLFET